VTPLGLPPDVPADQTAVRRANLGVVLRTIAQQGQCSRARVAAETGLTRGTVSSLVAELIDLGLVCETGGTEPRGVGRPGVSLELAGQVVGVGVEVNVDCVAVVVETLSGSLLVARRVVHDLRGVVPEAVIDEVAAEVLDALAAAGRGVRPVGVCVAVAGLVARDGGSVVVAPNLGWHDVALADALRERIGMRVEVENEANLAALAEHWCGAAQDVESFVSVFGEIGVGGGVMLAGRLYRGSRGFGGEIGHMVVRPGGDPCACGSRGCLETYVGQEAIARRAGVDDAGARGVVAELVRRASGRDSAALDAIDGAGRDLGQALASVVNLFDVQVVVLGGSFAALAPWLRGAVEDAIGASALSPSWSAGEVRISTLGEQAAVRGAAASPLRRLLDDPWSNAQHLSVAEAVV
jgi:predicted NBD/HSP70 family sugar kinase